MREGLRGVGTMVGLSWAADRWRTLTLLGMRPVAGLVTATTPFWRKEITDAVLGQQVGWALRSVAGLVAVALSLDLFVQTNIVLERRLREAVDLEIDSRLVDVCSRIPTVDHHERAEYLDRVELLRGSRGQLSSVVSAIAGALITVAHMSMTLWLLATVHPTLLLLPVFGVPTVLLAGPTQRSIEKADEATAEANRQALHLFDLATTPAPAKELRVFTLGDEILNRHDRLWTDVCRVRSRARLRAVAIRSVGSMLFSVGFIGAIAVVARAVAAGHASAGDMVLVLTIAAQVNFHIAGLTQSLTGLLSSLRVVGRLHWLVDYAASVDRQHRSGAEAVSIPDRLCDGISLHGVSYRYPDSEVDVLTDIDLQLPAGATVAIVGHNGAGKSTLVKLLCRYHEPTAGTITIDGTDLGEMDVVDWRERTTGAFQDYVRFELTLREAVGIGDLAAHDDERVRAALDRAAAAGLVDELGEGLETMLGPSSGGVDMSGGQWQKVAVARAMMRRAPLLLVLDEPTAALDAETEHALFGQYAAAARQASDTNGAITLIVSHRFSTVRMADLIVVLDDTRVVESGSHSELMARRGLYASLYEVQARSYQ